MTSNPLGNTRSVTAFAPASVGNVAVGFDVLGHAISGLGDRVTVQRSDKPGVRVTAITGTKESLPLEAEKNTAAAALLAMVDALALGTGFSVSIEKGIPLSAGLGGSAASAVAAVVALNQMLKIPLSLAELYPFALQGEAVASGGLHGDNVGASLLGGLVVCGPDQSPRVTQLRVPSQLRCVVVHPELKVETKRAREVLPRTHTRELVVRQMSNLAAFLVGCANRDIDLIADSLRDVLIEPKRASLIPGFKAAQQAAMDAGAIGCSISGAGPSIFAWCATESATKQAGPAIAKELAGQGLKCTTYDSAINGPGARVV